MKLEFMELIDELVVVGAKATSGSDVNLAALAPTALVINKTGKYIRGNIIDHNIRVNSDQRVRGRLVMIVDGAKREIDANDVTSVEAIKS